MEKGIETDYMELTSTLMSNMTDDYSHDAILNHKPLIDNICDIVESTPIFQDNIKRFEAFKDELLQIKDLAKRLEISWYHFCERTALAPTSVHTRGVVIFCLPAVRWVLNDIVGSVVESKEG